MSEIEQFSVQYYHWSREDFTREIAQDFPFLRRFKTGSAFTVVQMLSAMNAADKATFANALTKRFHPDAVKITGGRISKEEQSLLDLYGEKALEDSPAELLQQNAAFSGRPLAGPNRRRMRQLIKAEMKRLQLLDQPQESGVFFTYVLPIGDWRVTTEIDTRGEFAEIIYDHNIISSKKTEILVSSDGKEVTFCKTLGRFISLHSWLGISSQTQWTALTESDLSDACECLRLVCFHFLQAAPRLLAGL